MRSVVGLLLALACAGCGAPAHQVRDRDDYLAEATRVYPGESRERILKAAEAVLRQSDPPDFEFRYTLTGFTGLRRYVIYAVITAAVGREKWEFFTEPDPGGVRSSVSISEEGSTSGAYGSQNRYESAMASVPLYRLFWNRVDFMLGRRPDWISCAEATAALEASNTNVMALGGLCGPTSDGRNSPPPDPFPPLAPPVAEKRPTKRPAAT
jgi:hypothetical protein